MTDQAPAEPAVEHEGQDDSHDVPADLTVLHEVIEWEAAQHAGPNETTAP